MWFRRMYELGPIDFWDKSLSLKKVYGMYTDDVKREVENRVWNYSKYTPHTIRCGIIGNPEDFNFEPVVYAKIENNGTVYAFTNAVLHGFDLVTDEDDLPF